MSAPSPSVAHGVGFAFVLSLAGAAVLAALAPWLGAGAAVRTVVALTGFAYVLYVVGRSGERVGRITTLACWTLVAGGTALLALPLAAFVLLHVGLVWLVRSLYRYSGLVPALADLGLALLGAAFGAWAAQRSGSAWLALWCFFLVQAFYALVPVGLAHVNRAHDAEEDAFARARRTADEAVRRLSAASR